MDTTKIKGRIVDAKKILLIERKQWLEIQNNGSIGKKALVYRQGMTKIPQVLCDKN